MKLRFILSFFVLSLALACSSPGKLGKNDNRVADSVRTHIYFLADDKLEGRRTGTPGEKLAMEYIANEFAQIGLAPRGEDGYFQAFDVYDGRELSSTSYFVMDKDSLHYPADYFPLSSSPASKQEAQPGISLQEADMPWFIDLKDILEENKNNPHFDLDDYLRKNTAKAKERGATAVILFNSSEADDHLAFDAKDRSEKLPIPVFYVSKTFSKKYFSDPTASVPLKFAVEIKEKHRTGHNVVGYIDNHAATTVVIGGHFDHLGYGEDGNSMIRHFDSPQIHNGADDNASGTAAVIEMARKLKGSKLTANNYLFITFSGEELGLFGSKHYVEHPTIDLKSVSYMINMDMVGRLSDSTHVVTLGGYGTSPAWGQFFPAAAQSSKHVPSLQFKYDSSGTGPSDHTSFYRKDIPVLFYFTGLHSDYHKPSDDADKINYAGEQLIIKHIYRLIEWMNGQPRPAFTKTRETQTTTRARFSVTMGIVPDYTFAGTGVRADGVSDDKPAQKAGIKGGDVILQIGDYQTSSLENYMQALGKFKKGDRAKVIVLRGKDKMEFTVEF